MHELKQQLELIFGASILYIDVNHNSGIEPINFQHGMSYSSTTEPFCVVRLSLHSEDGIPNPMHAFDGISNNAHVTSMKTQRSIFGPLPTYIVEFRVYNLEVFYKDITTHCWNHFNNSFTKQLDNVLEEE